MDGYFTNYGYMGYVTSENYYRLFATEKEYEEICNELANNTTHVMEKSILIQKEWFYYERKNILDS